MTRVATGEGATSGLGSGPARAADELATDSLDQVTANARRANVLATLGRLSRTGELPTMPSVATSALAIARNPDSEVDELCRAIQTDIGIAARVLRVANSAMYGRRTVCKGLRDAVTTVGMRGMQDILSAAALRSLIDLREPAAQRLWDHSLAVAIAAEELARVTGTVRRGTAFIPGLFHDVGRIVLFLGDPAGYAAMVAAEMGQGESGSVGAVERELHGFDHSEAGAALASDWGLPPEYCAAARWHHAPSSAPAGDRLARLIAAADALTYRIGLGASECSAETRAPQAAGFVVEDEDAVLAEVQERFAAERAQFD
jgi:putative nucleotidyltransferase with HDIG domain